MHNFLHRITTNRRFAVLFMLLLCVLFTISAFQVSSVTYRADTTEGSWVQDDDGLYGNDSDAKKLKDTKDSDDEPGLLEGLLIKLVNAINGWLDDVLKSVGLSFDNIIFGRVNGNGIVVGGHRMALYTYELHDYNVYGIISMAIYNTIRSVILVVLIGVILFRLVSALYMGNSARILQSFKDSMGAMVLGLVLLVLMPYILDVAIYIRDVILQSVASAGSNTLGISMGKNLQITSWFSKNADKSIMNAVMWTASFILMLYFAIQYIGIAMCMIVNIIAFPFICLNMQFDKQALQNWGKQTISYLVIPIADVCLLMIPAAFGVLAGGSGNAAIHIVQFLVCTMILTARSSLQNAMGIMRNPALEMGSMLTFLGMAKLGGALANATVGNAVRGIGGAIGAIRGGAHDVKDMNRQADMYQDMANAEQGIMPDTPIRGEGARSFGSILGSVKAGMRGESGGDTEAFTGAVRSGSADSVQNPSGSPDPIRREDVYGESGFATQQTSSQAWDGVSNTDTSSSAAFEAGDVGVSADANTSFSDSEMSSDTASASNMSEDNVAAAKQAVLNKYANKDNFDTAQFSKLSNERKAQLQRERAADRKKQAFKECMGSIGKAAAGTAAGLTLGALAGGITMMTSPGISMMAASGGVNGGNALGGRVGQSAASALAGVIWDGAGRFSTRNNSSFGPASFDDSFSSASNEPVSPNAGGGGQTFMPAFSTSGARNETMAGTTSFDGSFSESSDGVKGIDNQERKDFANFAGQNETLIRGTMSNVANIRQKGTEGRKIFEDSVKKHEGGSYYACRAEVAGKMSDRFSEIMKSSDYVSTGSAQKDAAIIDTCRSNINKMFNPVDSKKNPLEVPDEHPLSRKSFENAGITFKD